MYVFIYLFTFYLVTDCNDQLVDCKAGEWSCGVNDKIVVCVRKRPCTTHEVKLNNRDILNVSNHQTVILDELKIAVDLTKFVQKV